MPLYAQIICIGGQALFALFFVLGGIGLFGEGKSGPGWLLIALAAAALYSLWVLLKFRRYLGAEQALEREAHIAELQDKLDALNARRPDASSDVSQQP